MGITYSWKARGVAVRDARHTHDGPEVAKPAAAARKDKKRWCRGKAGVEHVIVVTLSTKHYPSLVQHCSTCGKEFGMYSGVWGEPPEWATQEQLAELTQARQKWRSRFSKAD